MNLWERFRQFWRPTPEPDHPLSEREREDQPPETARDELADAASEYLGAGERDRDATDD